MPSPLFILSQLIYLYILLIIVWVFSSWFPQWRTQAWFRYVNELVEPYMNLFRGLNLNYAGLDFAPIIGILLLHVMRYAILGLAAGGMH